MNGRPGYVRMRILAKNPTMDVLLKALQMLPEDLLPEFWFEYEPNPKKKRVYLSDWETFETKLRTEGVDGHLQHKDHTIWYEGFLPDSFPPKKPFYNGFDLIAKEGADIEPALRAFEHFSRFFDTYHSLATPIESLDKIIAARAEVLQKNPPFEEFYPEQHTEQPFDYAHAKFRFPALGWITYLSEECITDYNLNLDELRDLAWKFEEVGETASAGKLYRFQFSEDRNDWPEFTPKLTEISIRADAYNFREEEYRENVLFKRLRGVESWHKWLLPDGWWKG